MGDHATIKYMELYPKDFPLANFDHVLREYVDVFLKALEQRGEDDGKCDPMAEFEDACELAARDGENITVADVVKLLADEYEESFPDQAIVTLMLKSLEVADANFEGLDSFSVPVSDFITIFRDYYVNHQ